MVHEIRKCQNRRLFCAIRHRYIDKTEVCKLITDGADVVVIAKPTGDDITCSVLLQIVSTREEQVATALSSSFLLEAIRSQGNVVRHEVLTTYLEQSLKFLAGRRDPGGGGPISIREAHRLAAQNFRRWCAAWREIDRILQSTALTEPS